MSTENFLPAISLPLRIALENGLVVFLVKTAIDSALAPCGRAISVIANAINTGIGRLMVSLPWYEFVGSISLGHAHGDGDGRHAATNRPQRGLGKPETFNFLGF